VSDQLREIIATCGLSHGELSRRSGVDKTTLGRFMRGERGLSMKGMDSLGAVLGLEVTMQGLQSP
jgi:transcriptional regulator with XRE-family HTH domain